MILTVGMAVYDDYIKTTFTIQHLRMVHEAALASWGVELEILVVDNKPSPALQNFCKQAGVTYVPYTEKVGTAAPRNMVFEKAKGEFVVCIDSHVMLYPQTLEKLIIWYRANPNVQDLFSGPMFLNDLKSYETHFEDNWRGTMWGTWAAKRPLPEEPFEIPASGLWLFGCRKDAWLGFNPNFRGFGGEEFYIHEKFRQAGRKCICLPWLQGWHSFRNKAEEKPKYLLRNWDKARNYVIGLTEIGVPLDRAYQHFVHESKTITEKGWKTLLADPLNPPLDPPCGSCGGGEQDAKPAKKRLPKPQAVVPSHLSLEQIYESTLATKQPHLPKLKELASQAAHVTEVAVKGQPSTIALLSGAPKDLLVLHYLDDAFLQSLKTKVPPGTKLETRKSDWNQMVVEPTDLLAITAPMASSSLWPMLSRVGNQSRRWIFIPSTQQFGEKDITGKSGLLAVLRWFMTKYPQWSVIQHSTEGAGYTVLGCQAKDKPTLPSMLTMGVNFAKALAQHVTTGAHKVSSRQLEQRLELCTICEHRVDNRCSVCGCPVEEKAAWATQQCPLGKWPTQSHPNPEAG